MQRSAVSSASSTSANTNSLNADAEANQQTNSISNSKGGNSSGSADSTAAETMVPLPAMMTYSNSHTATQVNHQSGLVAGTISFNLPSNGSPQRRRQDHRAGRPRHRHAASVHGAFAGAAQAYAQSMGAVPLLILAALVVVYIVLGVLYENTIHPLTILSTLPSAGIGATLALLIFGTPFSVIALIGIILLIGIVKKNGIMMVDVAIQLQRHEGMNARDAIHEAAVVRLRPIMMTTFAAVLGAVPLAIGIGQGASLAATARRHGDGRADPEPGLYALHDAGDLSLPRPAARASREVVRAPAVESPPRSTGYERIMKTISRTPLATAALALLASMVASMLAGCMVGPDYHRPAVPTPATWKELPGWTEAEPAADGPKGDWWTGFNEPAAQ